MSYTKNNQSGYTLVEVLVALAIIMTIAVPISFWLYKNPSNQQVYQKYFSDLTLKKHFNSALLNEGLTSMEKNVKISGFGNGTLKIQAEKRGQETCYTGRIEKNGTIVSQFVSCSYE